jgi:hypothetical protein
MSGARFGWIVLFAAVGCGSSGASSSAAGGSDGAALSPGEAVTSIGPIPLAAGVEKTVCITKRLGNDEDLVISSITATLAPGSHHLIVYRSKDTEENLTPTPCMPFTGLVAEEAEPIALIGLREFSWTFPSGVAIELPAHQMLRVEAHYINAGATALQGEGNVTFHGSPASSAPPWKQADLIFWGSTKIDLAAHSQGTLGPDFQVGIAGTHLISVTTHQHELGTGIQAWASAKPGDLANRITDDTDWAAPSWRLLDKPIDFNGTNGLSFKCNWNNTTSAEVTFGESALNEMCFVGGYYYPSRGFDLCLDGNCLTRTSTDGGAPDSGGASGDL